MRIHEVDCLASCMLPLDSPVQAARWSRQNTRLAVIFQKKSRVEWMVWWYALWDKNICVFFVSSNSIQWVFFLNTIKTEDGWYLSVGPSGTQFLFLTGESVKSPARRDCPQNWRFCGQASIDLPKSTGFRPDASIIPAENMFSASGTLKSGIRPVLIWHFPFHLDDSPHCYCPFRRFIPQSQFGVSQFGQAKPRTQGHSRTEHWACWRAEGGVGDASDQLVNHQVVCRQL